MNFIAYSQHRMKHTFLALLALGGCNNTSVSTLTTSFVPPGIGSTFREYNFVQDTTGAPLSHDTSVARIIQENVPYLGASDAFMFVHTYSDNGLMDTGYFRYTTDGDVQIPGIINNGLRWISYPFTTHTPQQFTLDTSIVTGTLHEYDTTVTTIKYEREENLVIKGHTFTCSVVSRRWTHSQGTVDGGNKTYSTDSGGYERWYPSLIGWIAHDKDLVSNTSAYDSTRHGNVPALKGKTLIDFTLTQ